MQPLDKRLIDPDDPPEGWEDYLKSLPCCACSRIGCDCTRKDYREKDVNLAVTFSA